MTLANLFTGTAASAVLGTLLEASLKGTVVLAVAVLVVFALQRSSAAHRHLVWVCALAGVVVLPALLVLPAWRVHAPALTWLAPASRTQVAPANPAPTPDNNAARSEWADPTPASARTEAPGAPAPQSGAPAASEEPAPAALPLPAVALMLWVIGALAVLATIVVGHLELNVLLRRARPVGDGAWHALATEAAEELRLRRPFTLLHGGGLLVPVASGFVRPRVLLPAGSDAWPVELRKAVLLHELAHVQRYDCLTQAVAQVACALFWFHPGVWWAASRMRAEREHACDDRVLAARTRASDYAQHLLGIVRSLRTRRLAGLGAVAFARPSSLEGRLLAVLDPRRDRRAVRFGVAAPAAIAAAMLVVPFALLKPVEARSVMAHWQKPRHREAVDPKTLRPSRLVPVPEPTETLEQRVAWARTDAARSNARVYWIGWRIETSPSMRGNHLSDSEGISIDLLQERGLFSLDDVITGRGQGTWNLAAASSHEDDDDGVAKPTAVLVRMEQGTPDRVRVQSLSLPAEFAGTPLYWMDSVPDGQIFAWLRDAAGRAKDEQLHGQFVESIGTMGRSELVTPFLKSTLEGTDAEEVRKGAAEGLGRHPSKEVVRLLSDHARTDRSPEVRRASVEALGQLQTPDALEALLAIAHAGEGGEVARRAAYDALGEKISRRSVSTPPGYEAARERAEKERESAERQNEQVENDSESDDPSPSMPSADLEVQRQAIESLGRYPEAQSLPRLRHIADTSPYGDLRREAVESIGRLGTPATLGVLNQIAWKNAKSDTRRAAVEMIGRVDSPQALELLEKIIKTGNDPEPQRQAVESMGRRGDPGIEGQLIQIARTHRSVDVRRQAVESLGRRDGKQVARELLELAKAEGPEEVQRQAVESLARLDADVMPDLAQIARTHPSSEVRRQAVDSMVRRDAGKALPLLEGILRQPEGKTGM